MISVNLIGDGMKESIDIPEECIKEDSDVSIRRALIKELTKELGVKAKYIDIMNKKLVEMAETISELRRAITRLMARPKRIIFDEAKRATVVLWKDGTKTIVHADDNDIFDKEKGLALCYMKKLGFNNRSYFNEMLKGNIVKFENNSKVKEK